MSGGIPVPPGFVVAADEFAPRRRLSVTRAETTRIATWLSEKWTQPLVCRSSALDEDLASRSKAGAYRTALNIRSSRELARALSQCAESVGYSGGVLIQRQIASRIAGVLASSARGWLIEANWGQGLSVSAGMASPDRVRPGEYEVQDKGVIALLCPTDRTVWPGDLLCLPGDHVASVRVIEVDEGERMVFGSPLPWLSKRRALDATGVRQLLALVGPLRPRSGWIDVEWCRDGNAQFWVLQARPLASAAVRPSGAPAERSRKVMLRGTPASAGIRTGRVHIVHGPSAEVRPQSVVVVSGSRPSLYVHLVDAVALVSEFGGLLSHAAIVARELGIPAVVDVPEVTRLLRAGERVVVDGGRGTIRPAPRGSPSSAHRRSVPRTSAVAIARPRASREHEPGWLRALVP